MKVHKTEKLPKFKREIKFAQEKPFKKALKEVLKEHKDTLKRLADK